MVKKIPIFSIEGQGALQITDAEKKVAEKIACTFHGGVCFKQNPTSYMEALNLYKQLPALLKENPENVVAIKVWLHPLRLLNTKAARLEREISISAVSNTVEIMEDLWEAERICNDLSERTLVKFSVTSKRGCAHFRALLQNTAPKSSWQGFAGYSRRGNEEEVTGRHPKDPQELPF